MTNEKLDAIAKSSAAELVKLFAEENDRIIEAITEITEAAHESEDETIAITLSHNIKLDLTKNVQSDQLSYSVRRKNIHRTLIPDPNQPGLFEGGEDDDA